MAGVKEITAAEFLQVCFFHLFVVLCLVAGKFF